MTTPHPSTPWDIEADIETVRALQLTDEERRNGRLKNIQAALGALADGLAPEDRDWLVNICHVIANETNALVDDYNRQLRALEMRHRLAEQTNATLAQLVKNLGG